MKKSIVFVVIALLLIAGYCGYNQYTTIKNNNDEQVRIDAIQGIDDIKSLLPSFDGYAIISIDDALQLVSEQIDISNFTISLSSNIFREGEDEYYLFDIVNKSGPSFAEQIAINTTTGEMFSFSPSEQKLSSMKDFPIETPIAKQQEWSGEFVNKEKTYVLQLLQADNNSFEFAFYENTKAATDSAIVLTSQRADDDDDDDNDYDDDHDHDDRVTTPNNSLTNRNPSTNSINSNKPNSNTNQSTNSNSNTSNQNGNNTNRKAIFSGIGRIDGSKAKYVDGDLEILFTKKENIVVVSITTKNMKMTKMSGEYELKTK